MVVTEKRKIYIENWRKENKERIKQVSLDWREKNKERLAKYHKNWVKENPEKISCIGKRCNKNNPEIKRRNNSIRKRELGYKPINKKDGNNVGHHIDKNCVIYIPKNMHISIQHAQHDKESMRKINTLAIQVVYI